MNEYRGGSALNRTTSTVVEMVGKHLILSVVNTIVGCEFRHLQDMRVLFSHYLHLDTYI